MAVKFNYIDEFAHRAKALAKKYKSFEADYADFLDSMEENPYQGTSLGRGVYKTRMAITSKGKGKSGGARVLTYNITESENGDIVVTLLSIFDKSEMDNVSDVYISDLVRQAKLL